MPTFAKLHEYDFFFILPPSHGFPEYLGRNTEHTETTTDVMWSFLINVSGLTIHPPKMQTFPGKAGDIEQRAQSYLQPHSLHCRYLLCPTQSRCLVYGMYSIKSYSIYVLAYV